MELEKNRFFDRGNIHQQIPRRLIRCHGLPGTYDNFTDGDPSEFLRNLNNHMPTAKENKLIFIEKTGHTYQMKNQEVADDILHQLQEWRAHL